MTPAGLDDAASLPTPAPPRTGVWRRVLPPLLLLLGVIGLVYLDSFAGMERIWARSDSFAHGYVVGPISLWLIWRQRAELARQLPAPSPWLLLPIGLAVLGWLAGQLVAVNSMTQLMATAMLVLAVPLVLGWRVAMVILFPLAYLFFAVPIGEFMVPVMMQWTADFTIAALRLSGIPVYREGLQFIIPSGSWSVVEACSGVRYLMASFMVGCLFAYLNYASWRRRLIFALVSLAVPIVANWLRAYMIVMLGHYSGNQLAVGADHLVYGWVFFGIVITIVFMVGARWSEPPREQPAQDAAAAAAAAAAPAWRVWATAAAGVALVALPPLLLARIEAADAAATAAAPRPVLVAPAAAGWKPEAAGPDAWRPAFTPAAAELQTRYSVTGTNELGLWVGYYRNQNEGSKLVSSLNQIVTSQDRRWNAVEGGVREHPLSGGRTLPLRETVLLGGTDTVAGAREHLVVWQFYWIDGRLLADDHRAKLAAAWDRLRGRGDDGAAVVLHARAASAEAARRALDGFVRENLPMLERDLAAARMPR